MRGGIGIALAAGMAQVARRAFTLIELLIVVVIIGILAAIAIPKFANTKGSAEAAALKSDLRNLVTAQEAYFYTNSVYTTSTAALSYNVSPGVTVSISSGTATGWAATATHPAATPHTCGIFIGNASPPLAATTSEGTVGCQ